MKAVNIIVKILAALAAIAGVVYVIATYGDKIVAWAKKLLGCECPCECECDECECACEEAEEAAEAETVEPVEVVTEEPAAEDADFVDAPAAAEEPAKAEENAEP